MGAVTSCIRGLGDVLRSIVNGIGSVLHTIISAIGGFLNTLISFLTCGYCGRRRSMGTRARGTRTRRHGRTARI